MKIATYMTRLGYFIRSLGWKRDKSIIVFGSWFGKKFADNSRYLYQYVHENKDALGFKHVVWVTANEDVHKELSDMGYEVYMMDSAESIYYHKHAAYHVICNGAMDILGNYSYGAKRINLWHGYGNKKFGYASNDLASERNSLKGKLKYWLIEHCKPYTAICIREGGWFNQNIVVTTDTYFEIFKELFLANKERLIRTGYARTCECVKLLPSEKVILEKMKQYKKTILYLPTFRQDNEFDPNVLGEVLREFCEKNDILLLQKLHSADKNEKSNIVSDNIVTLDSEFDINVLNPHIDLLITDYSSVCAECMYHDKPVVYYIPDIDEYKKGKNGLFFEPEELMIGLYAFKPEEIEGCVAKYLLEGEDHLTEEYERVKRLYWDKEYTLAEIWDDIVKHVEKGRG